MTRELTIDKRRQDADKNSMYTSEYTWHLTKRKNIYPRQRKSRTGIKYASKKKLEKQKIIKDAQEKVLTFAPRYSNIYTQSYWNSEGQRYLYMDVFSIVDGRFYKITKMVARVLGYRIIEKHRFFSHKTVMAVRNWNLEEIRNPEVHLRMEKEIVEALSKSLFGVTDGYFHESIEMMFPYDTMKISKQRDFRVRKNDD